MGGALHLCRGIKKTHQVAIRDVKKRLAKNRVRGERGAHIEGKEMFCGGNGFSYPTRHDLGNVAQNDRGVNMNDVGISLFQKFAERQNGQEWDTEVSIRGPFKRRETMDTYFMLDTVDVTRTVTGRNNPYLVSTVGEVCSESLCYRWNTADHGRILISHDHYTHT